ncbi:MAG: DUF2905 domain-containing protein [Anaerolineae bacterium]
MDYQAIGRLVLVIGFAIVIIGGLILLLGPTGLLDRIGSLPGDIRVQGSGFTCLVPIVSSILISVILTILLNIILRIINKP